MSSLFVTRAASFAYTLLWCLALPFLLISPRLRRGWAQRCGWNLPRACDVWIQGASAGECALIATLLAHPDIKNPADSAAPLRVLATSCTAQGLDMLRTSPSTHAERADITLERRYLPFDLPALMHWALRRVAPKAVVLVETELWPGLLLACAKRNVPVIVINGRMTSASLAGYLALAPVLRTMAPTRIAAIAPADALRFGLVFGAHHVQITGNMKFDRALATLDASQAGSTAHPLAALLPSNAPFVVLGSVREEEEAQVFTLIKHLRAQEPRCMIGLFPRHLSRCEPWHQCLVARGLPVHRRSELKNPIQPGDIILGDLFGELNHAYALAHRAFVGGSLARLGGQNFLEPLAHGVQAAVGPHIRNFAWIGDEIFSSLVFRSANLDDMARFLLSPAPVRHQYAEQVRAYLGSRQGATQTHCHIIIDALTKDAHA